VKNRHESAEKTKPKHLLCVTSIILRSKQVRSMLETHWMKATAVGESNNAGVWGRSTKPPEANMGSGAESTTLQRFYSFFPKIRIFRHILV